MDANLTNGDNDVNMEGIEDDMDNGVNAARDNELQMPANISLPNGELFS